MKRLMLLAVVAALCFISAAYAAEQLEVNDKGQVRLTSKSENWRPLTSEEREAYNNPGKEIPADFSPVQPRRESFFYISQGREYKRVVVYNNNRITVMEKGGKIYGEKKSGIIYCFSPYVSSVYGVVKLYKEEK